MVRNPGSPNRRTQPSRREGSHRFIGSSRKTPLIAVSRKFSFGSWNQWAISKEILPRILRKYFPPFKKRAHEDCPHFKSRLSHPRMKLEAGRVRDAPLGTLVSPPYLSFTISSSSSHLGTSIRCRRRGR